MQLCVGVRKEKVRPARKRYVVAFKSRAHSLKTPSMDDAMYQQLMRARRSKAFKVAIDPTERVLYQVQKKILQAVNPLLLLSEESLPRNQSKAVSDTLLLLSDAFFTASHQRRVNILRLTSPAFEYLLESPENFDREDLSLLYGHDFIKRMVDSNKFN